MLGPASDVQHAHRIGSISSDRGGQIILAIASNNLPLGTTIVSLALCIAIITVQTWVGIRVLMAIFPNFSRLVLLSYGILIGGVLTALLVLLAVSVGLNYRWGLVLAISIGVLLRGTTGGWQGKDVLVLPTESIKSVLVRSLALGFIGVSSYSLWSIFLGVAILMLPSSGLLQFRRRKIERIQNSLVLASSAIGVLLLIKLQPQWWHAASNDAPFFESLSWSLVRFGANSHPGFLHADVSGYHYLAYLWSGVISEFAGAPPFFVLNVILPFLTSFAIAVTCSAIHTRVGQNKILPVVLTSVLLIATLESSFTSYVLGSWGFITYVGAQVLGSRLWHTTSKVPKIHLELLLTMLGTITVLGKGTFLPVVICTGISFGLSRVIVAPRQSSRVQSLLPYHLILTTVVALIWFSPPSNLLRLGPSPLSNFLSLGLFDGLWESRDVLSFTPSVLLIGLLSVGLLRKSNEPLTKQTSLALSISCLAIPLSVTVMSDNNVRNYVYGHGSLVAMFFILALSSNDLSLSFVTKKFSTIAFFVLAFAINLVDVLFIGKILNYMWSSAPSRWIPAGVEVAKYPLIILLGIVIFKISEARSRNEVSNNHRTVASIMRVLVAFMIAVGLWHAINRTDELVSTWGHNLKSDTSFTTASHPDAETWELGDWIQGHTSRNSILGTNSFCCRGTDWLENTLTEIEERDSSYLAIRNREFSYGGANYLLPAVTRRRFYLVGPRFIIGGLDDVEQLRRSLEVSVKFGNQLDEKSLMELKRAQVDYFVFDKWLLNGDNTPKRYSQVVFENTRFVVVNLSD